jgi:prepilin-type N-terminal cleavage/methylation domain-containing protein
MAFAMNLTMMMSNREGLTITELMVVVTIVGVMAVIAVPAVGDIIAHYRLYGAAREIASTLQLLRLRSIGTNRDAYLDFTPGTVTLSDGFYTAFVDLDGAGDNDGTTEIEATKLNLNDSLGGYRGVLLPSGISFGWGTWGTDVTKRACMGSNTTEPADAVTFSGDRAKFKPSGSNARLGTVYLANTSISQFYAVSVAITGRVKVCRWSGSSWH